MQTSSGFSVVKWLVKCVLYKELSFPVFCYFGKINYLLSSNSELKGNEWGSILPILFLSVF